MLQPNATNQFLGWCIYRWALPVRENNANYPLIRQYCYETVIPHPLSDAWMHLVQPTQERVEANIGRIKTDPPQQLYL